MAMLPGWGEKFVTSRFIPATAAWTIRATRADCDDPTFNAFAEPTRLIRHERLRESRRCPAWSNGLEEVGRPGDIIHRQTPCANSAQAERAAAEPVRSTMLFGGAPSTLQPGRFLRRLWSRVDHPDRRTPQWPQDSREHRDMNASRGTKEPGTCLYLHASVSVRQVGYSDTKARESGPLSYRVSRRPVFLPLGRYPLPRRSAPRAPRRAHPPAGQGTRWT